MSILSEESRALLRHMVKQMDAEDALEAAAKAGWNAALEAAAEAVESMVDNVGDAASYDRRELYPTESERIETATEAAKRIRALKDQK